MNLNTYYHILIISHTYQEIILMIDLVTIPQFRLRISILNELSIHTNL